MIGVIGPQFCFHQPPPSEVRPEGTLIVAGAQGRAVGLPGGIPMTSGAGLAGVSAARCLSARGRPQPANSLTTLARETRGLGRIAGAVGKRLLRERGTAAA